MKIGIVGPIWIDIPPANGYGGTERVVYNLIEGLVREGHDVTLFGPENSKVSCKVYPTVDLPLRDKNVSWDESSYTLFHISEAFDHASEFDILHVHLNKSQDYFSLPLSLCSDTPAVFTLHFSLPTMPGHEGRLKVLSKYANLSYVSISNSQRKIPELNYVSTVYNGVDIDKYPFVESPEDYFVWLGKIKREKGTKDAILAAKKAGVKLILMGPVEKGVSETLKYFEEEVKPLIDGEQIIWKGEVPTDVKVNVLGKAKAFLNPISWEEPFGLVMAESQAVGTPVISYRRGSAPELIMDGKTGFLVDDLEQMVQAMGKIDAIERAACRQNILERFSNKMMVEGYVETYKSVIANRGKTHP